MFKFDNQFFEKHQDKLLFIANKWYLRWLLGIHKLPKQVRGNLKNIDKITPSTIHSVTGINYKKDGSFKDYKVEMYSYFSNQFAEELAFNLSPFSYIQNFGRESCSWRFSPVGILGCLIIALFPKLVGGYCFMGTTTDFQHGGCDEPLGYSTTWATVQAATYANYGIRGDGVFVGIYYQSNGEYWLSRTYFVSDNSSIPDTDSVTACDLVLNSSGCESTGAYDPSYKLYQATCADIPTRNDMGAYTSTLVSDTEYKKTTWPASGSLATYVFNSSGCSFVNKTGKTKTVLRQVNNDVNNTSTGLNANEGHRIGAKGITNATTSYRPYLHITYGSAGPAKLKTWNGLAVAKIKTINGLAIAKVKTINGLT